MPIIGIDGEQIIVASWGKIYYVNIEDILNGNKNVKKTLFTMDRLALNLESGGA